MILPRSGRTACVRRSRPCLAEPPAESPSTRNSSRYCGSRSEQSASFAASPSSSTPFLRVSSRALRAASPPPAPRPPAPPPLPPAPRLPPALPREPLGAPALLARQLARLAGRLARLGGAHDLVGDLARGARVLLERLAQLVVHDLLDQPLHVRVAELGLGLALELRLGQAHRHDGAEPLAHVVARHAALEGLEEAVGLRVGRDRPGHRRAEAGQVRAALARVDVVGEREDALLDRKSTR